MSQLVRAQACLRLSGEVSFDNTAAINLCLQREMQPGITQLDCSGITYADSALVALLIEARKLAQVRGLSLHISGLPAATAKLAALYGVQALL